MIRTADSRRSAVAGTIVPARWSRPRGRSWIVVAVNFLILSTFTCFCGEHALAQDTRPAAPTTSAATKDVAPAASSPGTAQAPAGAAELPTKIRYLLNDQGQLVPVPVDARLEAFLQWLAEGRDDEAAVQPMASVSSVDLAGSADDSLATLSAKIRVQVTGARQPLLFSLGLNEAVILDSRVESSGRAIFAEKDADQGYQWWLDGNATYDFHLKLGVPIRRVSPWRRLQLSLPLAPVSQLQLVVPEPSQAVKMADDILVETRPHDEHSTQIRAAGFGNKLDLQWQPTTLASNQRATLDVNTTMLVRGTSNGFIVEATQYVKALRGMFREFTVRLPAKSELLQVDGPDIKETRVSPSNAERITVELNAPTAGSVVIKWSVRIPSTPSKRTFLDGFSVELARRQSGEIGLLAPEGARWTISDIVDSHLERMNAGELQSALGGSNIVRAYRFFDQPFRLPLELQPVEVFYDVRPTMILYAGRDELKMEARYSIRTFRGELKELSLAWPGWRTDGWKLEPVQTTDAVVTSYSTDDSTNEGRIVIAISDAAPSLFELRIAAIRETPREADARVTLPRLEAPSVAPARVVFLHAENVDADITPRGETILRPAADQDVSSVSLGYPSGLKSRQYRLETDERQVSLNVTPQPLRIVVDSRAAVRLLGRQVSVRQQLQHAIQYERVSELLVAVPSAIDKNVRFSINDQPVLPIWAEGDRPEERVAHLTLPASAIGAVNVQAEWEQALPEELWSEREATILIPLAAARSGTMMSSLLEFERPPWYLVSGADTAWTLEHTDDALIRWSAPASTDSFTGLIAPTTGVGGAEFLASRALIAVDADRSGQQGYRMDLQLSGNGPHLNVQLPGDAQAIRFYWNGLPIPVDRVLELPVGSRRFTLPWPDMAGANLSTTSAADDAQLTVSATDERLLTIEYTMKPTATSAMSGMLSGVRTRTPRFPQVRWGSRAVWQVTVPDDQHLFMPPSNAAPLYQWQRRGLLWRRTSIVTAKDVDQWIGGSRMAPAEPLTGRSHVYSFSQFGPVEDLSFRVMSSAGAFLAGAGLSLLLGFLAIKSAILRSAFVTLCVACVAILAALWFLPQFELLLQPMLFGGFLALLLGLQELWNRRRAAGTILTLSAAPSDVQVPYDEMPNAPSLLLRTHDSATVFREPPREDSRGRVPAESHVG